MIRIMHTSDIDNVVALWLETSLHAHNFIDDKYWRDNQSYVKNVLLPQAKTYVYVDKHQLKGFISMIDGNSIGALFVNKEYQGRGIGRKLLSYVRRQKSCLQLRVYVKNVRALQFYQNASFKIVSETTDKKTREKELLMVWSMGCASGHFKRLQGDS